MVALHASTRLSRTMSSLTSVCFFSNERSSRLRPRSWSLLSWISRRYCRSSSGYLFVFSSSEHSSGSEIYPEEKYSQHLLLLVGLSFPPFVAPRCTKALLVTPFRRQRQNNAYLNQPRISKCLRLACVHLRLYTPKLNKNFVQHRHENPPENKQPAGGVNKLHRVPSQ